MREIKFRGKTKNGKWIYGNLICRGKYCCILEEEKMLHPLDEPYLDTELGTFDGKATPIIIETVGQYTELKDKNGVEIYESDLVKYKFGKFGEEIQAPVKFGLFNHNHCDVYNCEHYGWYLDYEWDNYCHKTGIDLYTISELCEVIGNAYENKH